MVVDDIRQTYETLPDQLMRELRQLVGESMDLFRDDQSNPAGPLNGHSLSKLDDDIRANLGGAVPGLRSFGLKLEPDMY